MNTAQETTSNTPSASNRLPVLSQNLTTRQAADYLGLKETTLEQWRWSGRGPRFVKLGRVCRYRLADLEAFVETRIFSSTTEAQAIEV